MKKCTLLVFEQIQVGPRWSLQVVTLKTRRLFKNCSRKAESTSPNTSSIPVDLSRSIKARYLSRYLLIYWVYKISDIACNVLIPKGYLFVGLHNPYRTRKAQGLCKPNWNKRPCLKGPLSSYLNKEVEKENPSPGKLHKIFFLKP